MVGSYNVVSDKKPQRIKGWDYIDNSQVCSSLVEPSRSAQQRMCRCPNLGSSLPIYARTSKNRVVSVYCCLGPVKGEIETHARKNSLSDRYTDCTTKCSDEAERTSGGGHVLQRHRCLQSDERCLKEAADSDSCDH